MKVIDSELLKSAELQPLQQLAAVRMAISICRAEDVQCMIGSFSRINGNSSAGYSDDQWKQLCDKVKNKLEQISVPKLIIETILKKMWPISFEIFKWILCHDADMGIDSSSKFYWTPLSNIDYKKTAKMLIKNETIDIKNRFKLACFYCLAVEVRSLWEIMSLPDRRSFFERGNLKKLDLNWIVLYWTYYIQDVPIDYWKSKALNNSQLFIYSVKNGYPYATKFFLGKMRNQLRSRMISNSFTAYIRECYRFNSIVKSSHFTTAYFLISELSPAYRYANSLQYGLVFRYFLEWLLQNHFMTVVDRLKCAINDRTYGELLKAIFEKEIGDFRDYDYKKLFMEFWRRGTEEHKSYVNRVETVGFKIFFRFVKKHFGFVFDEKAFELKAKFRSIVLHQQEISEVASFEKEDVEFFKFLLRERVTTKASINEFLWYRSIYSPITEFEVFFYNLPLGELMYLIDGVLEIV